MKEPKFKRIALKQGSARVSENCSQEMIDMLNVLVEKAYHAVTKTTKKLK